MNALTRPITIDLRGSVQPSLRFDNASIDQPRPWARKRLGELVAFFKGAGLPRSEIVENGNMPCIHYGDLFTRYSAEIREVADRTNSLDAKVGQMGDVIMPSSDVTPDGLCKASALLCDNVVLGGDINILRPKKGIHSSWLSYALRSRPERIIKLVSGTTVKHVYARDLASLMMFVPPIDEQIKVASALSSVDAKIDALKTKKSALEDYKRGLMQKLFSRKIRFTREDGGAFPNWDSVRLKDIAEIVGGGTPDSTNENFWKGDINWFTPSEIKMKYIGESARKISQDGLRKSSAKMLPAGALVLTTRATVGEVAVATKPCSTNQGFQSLVLKSGHDVDYWYYWIKANKRQFLRRSAGSTFPEIGKSEVATIPALAPTYAEQVLIGKALSAVDKKIDAIEYAAESTRVFKSGLLQKLFV